MTLYGVEQSSPPWTHQSSWAEALEADRTCPFAEAGGGGDTKGGGLPSSEGRLPRLPLRRIGACGGASEGLVGEGSRPTPFRVGPTLSEVGGLAGRRGGDGGFREDVGGWPRCELS